MKTLLLFDANSLVHRAFHALPPLTEKSGKPAQALYGLSSILLKLWRENKPDYAAALFDSPEPTFREEHYKEYKATRAETHVDLLGQLKEAPRVFELFGARPFAKSSFEADDLIATFVELFRKEKDLNIIILTGDLDTLQLVGKNVAVRAFRTGVTDTALYDEKGVEERYGLTPEKMLDYKILVGDVSDNVKGVPGIGPKTATELLQKHGSIETALKRMEEGKTKEKLFAAKEIIEISRKVLSLRRDVPVDVHLKELKAEENTRGLTEFFEEKGFKALQKRMEGAPKEKSGQGQIF